MEELDEDSDDLLAFVDGFDLLVFDDELDQSVGSVDVDLLDLLLELFPSLRLVSGRSMVESLPDSSE